MIKLYHNIYTEDILKCIEDSRKYLYHENYSKLRQQKSIQLYEWYIYHAFLNFQEIWLLQMFYNIECKTDKERRMSDLYILFYPNFIQNYHYILELIAHEPSLRIQDRMYLHQPLECLFSKNKEYKRIGIDAVQ